MPLDKRESLKYRHNRGTNSATPCGRITLLGSLAPVHTGRYKLIRQTGGRGFYADVTVETRATTGGPQVEVGPSVFAWLKDVYGPNAWEWSVCDDFRAAAVRGVGFALTYAQQPIDPATIAVVVTQILAAPADTCSGSVAFAACHATWQALGVAGRNAPRLVGREVVFDG